MVSVMTRTVYGNSAAARMHALLVHAFSCQEALLLPATPLVCCTQSHVRCTPALHASSEELACSAGQTVDASGCAILQQQVYLAPYAKGWAFTSFTWSYVDTVVRSEQQEMPKHVHKPKQLGAAVTWRLLRVGRCTLAAGFWGSETTCVGIAHKEHGRMGSCCCCWAQSPLHLTLLCGHCTAANVHVISSKHHQHTPCGSVATCPTLAAAAHTARDSCSCSCSSYCK